MLAERSNIQLAHRLKNFSRWDAWLVVLGGAVVLLGWSFGNEMFKRVFPGMVAMNPVTALGFIMAGASLACFWYSSKYPAVGTNSGRILAAVVVAIGVLKLLQYWLGWQFPFDQTLFANQLPKDPAGFHNQIAPNTAVNFVLSGLGLLFLNSSGPRCRRWAQKMSLTLLFVSLVPLVGYLYRASYLYSVGSYIPMALHTAILFYLLAHGLLLAQADFGVVALFASKTPGGTIARRLLPFAFGVPIVLGAFAIAGEKHGFYPAELSHTVVVVGSLTIFTILIWWNALLLNRADACRREAEDQLRRAHDELEVRVQERTAALASANEALCANQEQLLRSQRMESIGSLAGGIAHDLNNALAPVIMGADLLRQCKDEAQQQALLDTISCSAKRGTEMVKHILSFARGSSGHISQVRLPQLMAEMAKMVRDTFPKKIDIIANPAKELWIIEGDVTELHQVLLNLCVNARDAMPNGGQLTIAAENMLVGTDTPDKTGVPPGTYVVLTVADTGTGIAPDVLPRIFEPLFTTKTPDKGTGLGLSTVANIIKKHNGLVKIHTAIGKGTHFKIYLPATQSAAAEEQNEHEVILPAGHGELILIVDDEEAVRVLAENTLEHYGYRVMTAANGVQGIACFEEYRNEIRLVMTDTDMPVKNGLLLIQAIQKIRRNIPVIIASGAQRDIEQFRKLDPTYIMSLDKPYTIEQLLTSVAKALEPAEALKLSSV